MACVPDLADLFARLASHLDAASSSHRNLAEEDDDDDDDDRALQLSVSNLNRSLNLDDDSGVRVLDTALSLMCFKAPQVFDSVVKFSAETIGSVLSSSIGCKVLRFQKDEVLLIGCSISGRDSGDLIGACSDVLGKLEGHREHYEDLLYAGLRVAISSSSYRYLYPSRPMLDLRSTDARRKTVLEFLGKLPKGLSIDNNRIPFRLASWFLDPPTLKHDIENILHESMERPFLCLYKEFHERMDWRSTIKCLVLSPIMFIETRALLHRWFLLTGLASVIEFLIMLCSVVLDVVSRPTWWDISSELGAKLPFSNAYFPYHHHLLRTFAGPLSHASLLHLVRVTSELFSCTGKQFDQIIKTPGMKAEQIDHKSSWSLAINFPKWFYFASALLFSENSFLDNIYSNCISEASGIGKTRYGESPSSAAARYIAWILDPVSKSNQDLLAEYLVKISKALASKQFGSGIRKKKPAYDRKMLKKPKVCNKEYNTHPERYHCETIALWLKEFKSVYAVYRNKTAKSSESCDTKSSCDHTMQQNALFRRITFGILLGHLNYIEEDACDLLLHYATTDRVFQSREIKASSLKKLKCNHSGKEDIFLWIDEYNKEEAVAGACLVFSLTDIVESMSASLFETEEAGLNFICQVKMMVGQYLIKCTQRQIQLKIDEDGNLLVMDLCQRLKQWRHQGQGVLEIHKELDDLINVLSQKLSSI